MANQCSFSVVWNTDTVQQGMPTVVINNEHLRWSHRIPVAFLGQMHWATKLFVFKQQVEAALHCSWSEIGFVCDKKMCKNDYKLTHCWISKNQNYWKMKSMLAWLRDVNIAVLVFFVSWNVLTSSTLLAQPCVCTIALNGHAHISNLHCQFLCCCKSKSLSKLTHPTTSLNLSHSPLLKLNKVKGLARPFTT